MASKSQLKVNANINFPRNERIDGKSRTTSLTRGALVEIGEDAGQVSKARADWLVEKGYASHLNAKGESVDAEGKTVAYGSDEAVQAATREASAQHDKPVVQIKATGTPPGAAEVTAEAEADSEAGEEASSKKSAKRSK